MKNSETASDRFKLSKVKIGLIMQQTIDRRIHSSRFLQVCCAVTLGKRKGGEERAREIGRKRYRSREMEMEGKSKGD